MRNAACSVHIFGRAEKPEDVRRAVNAGIARKNCEVTGVIARGELRARLVCWRNSSTLARSLSVPKQPNSRADHDPIYGQLVENRLSYAGLAAHLSANNVPVEWKAATTRQPPPILAPPPRAHYQDLYVLGPIVSGITLQPKNPYGSKSVDKGARFKLSARWYLRTGRSNSQTNV